MADKVTRSSKMYKDSPKLERKDGGKLGVSKKPEAKKEEGNDGHAMSLAHKQEKERLTLHQKHELEHHDLAAKHMSEMDKNKGEEITKEQEQEGGEGQA